MRLQQVRVGLIAPAPGGPPLDLEPFIAILHRWIREDVVESLIPIDVGDYRHLRDRPRLLLVSHRGHLVIERRADGRIGLAFERKRDAAGPADERLTEALAIVLHAAAQLEAEPSLEGAVKFDRTELEVAIHSRLTATEVDAPLVDAVQTFAEAATRAPATIEPVLRPRGPATLRVRLGAEVGRA